MWLSDVARSGPAPTYDELAAQLGVQLEVNAALHVALDRLESENAASRELVSELRAVVESLQSRVAELEALLEEARRSGKRQAAPFSKGKKPPSGKRPGRRAGEGYGKKGRRERPAPEDVDRHVDAPLPESCPDPDCDGDVVEDRVDEQFQEDLPEPKTTITCFHVSVGHCCRCGQRVQGSHPEQTSDALGAAAVSIGPRALALAALLQKGMGLSHARVASVLGRFGLSVTPGGVTQALLRLGRKGQPTYDAMVGALAAQDQVTADETGWRIDGISAWLWCFVTARLAVYAIRAGRSFADATSVLPATFRGVLVRDGWAPYRKFVDATHQTCVAHLLRRCHEMIRDLAPNGRRIAAELRQILLDALALRANQSDIDAAVDALEARVDALLRRRPHEPANRRLLKHIAKERQALFTFLRRAGVDATNWRAEQTVRPAVVNRKTFGGNRTQTGARAQEVLTSILVTAQLQGIDPIEALIELQRSSPGSIIPFNLDTPDTQAAKAA